MVKRAGLITVVFMVLSAFLMLGCDGGVVDTVVDTVKELDVDLTDLSTDVDVVIEIVDSVNFEVLATVEGIPGELNVVAFADPGSGEVIVKVEVFEAAGAHLALTEESFTVDINADILCGLDVDLDASLGNGGMFNFSMDCPILPVDVDVDMNVALPWPFNIFRRR